MASESAAAGRSIAYSSFRFPAESNAFTTIHHAQRQITETNRSREMLTAEYEEYLLTVNILRPIHCLYCVDNEVTTDTMCVIHPQRDRQQTLRHRHTLYEHSSSDCICTGDPFCIHPRGLRQWG